ncbi:MAG: tRNA dihydrouridine synthase DusB [Tepidisphaerales bacterium]
MRPLRIRQLTLQTPLLLAPIAGYCDVSFRLIARACGGVGLAVTDLLCPEGVLRENYRSMQLAATCPDDSPLSMQLYGCNVERLCEAARWCRDHGADVIDLNMGCPVDKITKRDGGAKLLCDPDNTVRMAERIVRAVPDVPVTAKMRLGWDDTCIVAPRLARRLAEVGIAMVTVHGRTAEMRFSGEARLDGIAEVVRAVDGRIPVVGNGDVRCPEDARRMLDVTGCDGVMIGRAALAQPWIFRDTWALLTTGTVPPPPTLDDKLAMIRQHFDNLCHYRSERAAVVEFRKRVSWYAKTMHPCAMLKERVRLIDTPADFYQALDDFRAWRAEYDAAIAAGQRPWMDELVAAGSD